MQLAENQLESIIKNALQEDIQSGDITTEASVPKNIKAAGRFLVKQDGVISGLKVVEKTFHIFNPSLLFSKKVSDGDKVAEDTIAAIVEGNATSILSVERTALNFMQRMSGIATAANKFSEIIKHTKAKIIDTRKTVPGLRLLDKLAVADGGCENHRMGLYDMFLIKDNHITAAGSITGAVNECRKYQAKKGTDFKIEVETANLDQVEEALTCAVDIIMLDNYEIEQMKNAVKLIKGRCKIEVSGMVNINTVKEIAETGVDFISVGALTHSVKALDISLKIEINRPNK